MMELLKQWLVGITCAAMIVALADSLTPKGTVKKIGHIAGGLLLLLAVVKPLMEVDFSALAVATVSLEGVEVVYDDWEKTNTELMKTIIGEKTGAYILDKAEELGADCTGVAVECAVGEEDVPYPSAVTVTGAMTQAQWDALARTIEADLAIPRERQTYESGDTEP